MEQPGSDQRTAAMREEIRQAGKEVAWGRRFLARSFGILAAGAAFCMLIAVLETQFLDASVIASAVFIASAIIAPPLFRTWERERHRRLFRHRLRRLEPEKRLGVLLPLLQGNRNDAARIAAGLARDLGIRGELAPAPAPDGRGDETVACRPDRSM